MKVISTPVASVSGDVETSSAFVSLQGFAEEPKLEVNLCVTISHWSLPIHLHFKASPKILG
jgi:hypothetical protein